MATPYGIQQLLSTMRALGMLHPNRGAPPIKTRPQIEDVANVWLEYLADVPDEDLLPALQIYVRREKTGWYPSPGALLEICEDLSNPEESLFLEP